MMLRFPKLLRRPLEVLLDWDFPDLHVLSRRRRRGIEAKLALVNQIRPPRNYDYIEVERAKILAPRHYVKVIGQLGLGKNDESVVAHLYSIALALASERPLDFDAVYDGAINDERLSDDDKDVIASATLDMQADDLTIEVMAIAPQPPEPERKSPAISPVEAA